MKAIFLGDSTNINRVFSKQITQELIKKYNLDTIVYTKELIMSGNLDTKNVDYIFSTWGMNVFAEDEIKAFFPNLKAVFYAAGTVQYFAKPFLKCGVKVFSAWAANAVPVAEYTVAHIVLANKGFYKVSDLASVGKYADAVEVFSNYMGNYDAKVGIIGAGMIGKLVIEMLRAYRLDILVFDPFLSDEKALEMGVEKCSLERIFSECNVISNHLANNAQTKRMLNGDLFSLMLPYATILNTGRGAQIVEEDLIKTLTERPDITAILDVTEPEPPQIDSAFYKLNNCILTPHIAGSAGQELNRMSEYMLDEFKRFIDNKSLRYEVTEKMLETMA